MATSPYARMPETGRPRDLHQHCSICYFHFWQRRKIFYLGRHQDLVETNRTIKPRPDVIPTSKDEFLFLGEHYLFTFDRAGWRPLPRQSNAMDVSLSVISAGSLASTKSWPVFPICWDCFRVIREFLIFRNEQPRREPAITSLATLYAALHEQWHATNKDKPEAERMDWSLDWPHGSYRGPFEAYDRFSRAALLAETTTSESIEEWAWLMGDPYQPLPSLTNFLINHLQMVPTESKEADESIPPTTPCKARQDSSPLLRIPQEIISQITSYLDASSCFALRLACSQLVAAVPLDQRFWYDKFMFHKLFGFFFDFDVVKVMEEAHKKCLKRGKMPPHWDWKRLVHDFAKFSSFQNGGVLADAPNAFRNRRRIWKILEMAEIYHCETIR